MTIKEVEEKIKGKYNITGMKVATTYFLKLGNKEGTIILQYLDDKFTKMRVDGSPEKKLALEKFFGIN